MILSIFSLFGISVNEEKDVQNVILLIGDGMGVMTLEKTKQERGISLAMETMEQQGFCMTRSASDEVTDSAAGATALACGVKTSNGSVGYYWFDDPSADWTEGTYPKNITEACMEYGMKTGIVTTDYTSGATPSGFSVHTSSRNNTEDIYAQQLESGIDLIWGRSQSKYISKSDITSAGYTYVNTISAMNSVSSGEKSFGQFSASLYHTYNKTDYTPTLSQMTESAIEILSGSDEGFFLMVEGAHIDKKAADNEDSLTTEAVEEFDNAVAKALEFAEKDGHTLVIVTADHETGGITLNEDGTYSFTTTSHTAANVPVFAYGPYEFISDGEIIDNTDVPKRIAEALGISDFPAEA
ncbi:MAG: alkaline phosphatase [Clostridiales bacterium]|nr:alkaline phosphatase [Clostridiales bacterium]